MSKALNEDKTKAESREDWKKLTEPPKVGEHREYFNNSLYASYQPFRATYMWVRKLFGIAP